MPDFAKLLGKEQSAIAKIDGIEIANVAKCSGFTRPTGGGGASFWVAVQDDSFAAHASNASLNNWTSYDARSNPSEPDMNRLAYGEDGAGNPRWVSVTLGANAEVYWSDDPTDENYWNDVDITQPAARSIAWGNGVWIISGSTGATAGSEKINRSTDGANWNLIDISGLSGISNTVVILGLCTDGAGTWFMAQNKRIYKSTDNGLNWSLDSTQTGFNGDIHDLQVTNNCLVAMASGYAYCAALSDTTTFGTGQQLVGSTLQRRLATYQGKCMTVFATSVWVWDVSGTTISGYNKYATGLSHGTLRCIGTDGTTWVASGDTGDVLSSTDDGANWTLQQANVGAHDITDIKPNVKLPL